MFPKGELKIGDFAQLAISGGLTPAKKLGLVRDAKKDSEGKRHLNTDGDFSQQFAGSRRKWCPSYTEGTTRGYRRQIPSLEYLVDCKGNE